MREADRPLEHFPLIVFLVLYVVTFLLGASLLLVGPTFFVRLFARTVGIKPFWLDAQDVLVNWLLILGAPIFLVAGWILGSRRAQGAEHAAETSLRPGPLIACWVTSVGLAVFSLARAGTLFRVGAWLDYGALIQARFHLFDHLSFGSWTNLYILLPALSGLLAVRIWRSGRTAPRRRLAVVAIAFILIALELSVFQKRYVVLSLIYLGTCAAVNAPDLLARGRSRLLRVSGACGIAYVLYCALLVAPQLQIAPASAIGSAIMQGDTSGLLGSGSSRVEAAGAASFAESEASVRPARSHTYYMEIRSPTLKAVVERAFPGRWIGTLEVGRPEDRVTFLGRLAFALLGPVTRTPPPALAYPVLFPRVLPYFGLDVGADLIGVGRMPDDNLTVYGAMYGKLDKGATSVPFQYSWFSQIGLFGALALCVPLGGLCAMAWRGALSGPWPPEVRSALGGLVVLFCVGLSQDSVRGSLLNSYGVVWGALLVLAIWMAFRRRKQPVPSGRT